MEVPVVKLAQVVPYARREEQLQDDQHGDGDV
jgi:hypothetical protein